MQSFTSLFFKKNHGNDSKEPSVIEQINTVPLIQLRNGTQIPKDVVDFVMNKLRMFYSISAYMDPMAGNFLIQKCQNPNYQFMPYTLQVLSAHGLVDAEGNVPEAVKNVVLSAINPHQDKESFTPSLIDPRKPHEIEEIAEVTAIPRLGGRS